MQGTELLLREGLSFDDVLLIPQETDINPSDLDCRSVIAHDIELRVPILSSPMDRVTEARMAIAVAREPVSVSSAVICPSSGRPPR